jgi:hypothetical protein
MKVAVKVAVVVVEVVDEAMKVAVVLVKKTLEMRGSRTSAIRLRLTLWVPDRESYRSQMAKFFTFRGFFSWICSQLSTKHPNILASVTLNP